jgi:hypothetical protein
MANVYLPARLFVYLSVLLAVIFSIIRLKRNKMCGKEVTLGLRGLNFWDYFDGIYIISGDWVSNKKHADLYHEVDSVGLNGRFNIWPGVRNKKSGHEGAWHAHQTLISHAKLRGQECVLIFEDDVIFSEAFKKSTAQSLRRILKFLGSSVSWEIFFFGSNVVEMQAIEDRQDIVRVQSWALLAYVLNQNGMALFENVSYPQANGGTIDGISRDSRLSFMVYPAIAEHPSSVVSDTTGVQRANNLRAIWRYHAEILYSYATDPKKCWPRTAHLTNFYDVVDPFWETKRPQNLRSKPLMTCRV